MRFFLAAIAVTFGFLSVAYGLYVGRWEGVAIGIAEFITGFIAATPPERD